MTPEEVKEQVAEFTVWGFAERARKNALTTAFIGLILYSIYREYKTNGEQAELRREVIVLQRVILENRDRAAKEVDQIRKEHLDFLLKLLEEQKKNSENIQKIKRRIIK